MATRLYFAGSAAAPVSPAFDGGWNYTSEAVSRLLLKAKSAGESLAAGTQIGPWTATAGQTALDRQYVSPPLAAQTISGTFKGQIMVRELANTDNVDQLYVTVKVVSRDGNTVRATLFALANATTTVEFINNATCRNKRIADGDAISSYTCVDGDRLIVQIGYRNSTAATTPEALAKWGAPSGTNDLPENETQTTDGVGWIEFSHNVVWESFSGTSVLTADAPTLSASGKESFKGSSALTADAPTVATSGKQVFKGSSALVADAPTIAATGTVSTSGFSGTAALVADAPTLAASSKQVFKSSSALTADAPTVAASGKQRFTGASGLVADAPIVAASGKLRFAGSGALIADAPTMAASGKQVFKGSGSISTDAPTLAAGGFTGTVFSGSGALVAQVPVTAAAGKQVFKGTAALVADAPTIAANGKQVFKGTSVLVGDAPVLASSGTNGNALIGTGALVARPPAVASSGKMRFVGSAPIVANAPSVLASVKQSFKGPAGLAGDAPIANGSGTHTFVIFVPVVTLRATARRTNLNVPFMTTNIRADQRPTTLEAR